MRRCLCRWGRGREEDVGRTCANLIAQCYGAPVSSSIKWDPNASRLRREMAQMLC